MKVKRRAGDWEKASATFVNDKARASGSKNAYEPARRRQKARRKAGRDPWPEPRRPESAWKDRRARGQKCGSEPDDPDATRWLPSTGETRDAATPGAGAQQRTRVTDTRGALRTAGPGYRPPPRPPSLHGEAGPPGPLQAGPANSVADAERTPCASGAVSRGESRGRGGGEWARRVRRAPRARTSPEWGRAFSGVGRACLESAHGSPCVDPSRLGPSLPSSHIPVRPLRCEDESTPSPARPSGESPDVWLVLGTRQF